jgi:cobalt-precorrin 5A hydrolase
MAKRRMIAVIYLTAAGKSVAECLAAGWDQESLEVIAAGSSLSLQVRSLWDEYESFIFIMAVGIVVRLIAPLLKSKWDDPGVVVVDEGGHFAVSLVGGHWGGQQRPDTTGGCSAGSRSCDHNSNRCPGKTRS